MRKGGSLPRVSQIADWAASLTHEDIPSAVLELCRAQRRSVLGAIAAATDDPGAQRVSAVVRSWTTPGPAPLVGTGESVTVADALYVAAAFSMALDFDDYLCFGHTGHSAVLVPLFIAAETGADGTDQLTAQVIANEVEARLGGACLLGPLNGQLWSFTHAGGAALAAGRLMGLDTNRLAHALAIALTHPPRLCVPGFFAPDSKLLTAAEPVIAGLRAARLAAGGVTGPLDVLDHPQGFLAAFSYVPLPGLLSGLGNGWATQTLSVKSRPGCAYVTTTLDALEQLGPQAGDEVDHVIVRTNMAAYTMDALSQRYVDRVPTPVTVNFSTPWSAAILLTAGRLTPSELNPAWIRGNYEKLDRMRKRVTVRHDWGCTRELVAAFTPLLPPRTLRHEARQPEWLRGVRRLQADQRGVPVGDIGEIVRTFRRSPPAAVRQAPASYWDPDTLGQFAMTLPAHVRIVYRDGRKDDVKARTPWGAVGHARCPPVIAASEKLRTYGPLLWGTDGTTALDCAVGDDAADLAFWLAVQA